MSRNKQSDHNANRRTNQVSPKADVAANRKAEQKSERDKNRYDPPVFAPPPLRFVVLGGHGMVIQE